MTVRFTDGFDHYTSIADMTWRGYFELTNSTLGIFIASTEGRYGGNALAISTGDENARLVNENFPSDSDGQDYAHAMTVGFSFRCDAAPSTSIYFFGMGETGVADYTPGSGGQQIMHLGLNTSGFPIWAQWNDATINAAYTGNINMCDGQWHWLELMWRPAVNSGDLQCYVDGVQQWSTLANSALMNGGTRNTINEITDKFIFRADTSQGATIYIDDIIFYDSTPSTLAGDLTSDRAGLADFPIGGIRIETLLPDSTGTNADFTPLSSANYLNVDEAVFDGDATYVEASTSGSIDTYGYGSLSGTPERIYGVVVHAGARFEEAAGMDLKGVALSNAVSAETTTLALTGSYTSRPLSIPYDPNTSTRWTSTAINAAEFGIETETTT